MNRYPLRSAPYMLAGFALLAACGGSKDNKAASDSATAAATAANAATASATADSTAKAAAAAADPAHFSDANILAKKAAADSTEAAFAEMVRGMATSSAVKSFAAQLVTDHTKGLKDGKALATKLNMTPQMPAGDTTVQSASHLMQQFQGMTKGAAFDSAFVHHEIEDHQQNIKDAQAMSGAAQNAEVKAMLEKAVPELQKHLDRAQKLATAKTGK